MSKKAARRYLQAIKPGTTVKELLTLCNDMGFWFDDVLGTELEAVFYALCPESSLQPEND